MKENSGQFKKGENLGSQHRLWKGDQASYYSIHAWVARHKGRPKKCDECGSKDKKRYEWANISGKYLRNLNDYKRLCKSCHEKYDLSKLSPEAQKIRKSKYFYQKGYIPPTKQFNYKKCLQCDKDVRIIQARWTTFKYCSLDCRDKANVGKTPWNKGKKLHYEVWNKNKKGLYSDELRKAMGAKNIGIHRSPLTEFKKGKNTQMI